MDEYFFKVRYNIYLEDIGSDYEFDDVDILFVAILVLHLNFWNSILSNFFILHFTSVFIQYLAIDKVYVNCFNTLHVNLSYA